MHFILINNAVVIITNMKFFDFIHLRRQWKRNCSYSNLLSTLWYINYYFNNKVLCDTYNL